MRDMRGPIAWALSYLAFAIVGKPLLVDAFSLGGVAAFSLCAAWLVERMEQRQSEVR